MRGGGSVNGFDLKLFHEQVGNDGAYLGTLGCTMDPFIILTLEGEVCVFEAELHKGDYLGNGHAGPLGQ